MYTSLTLGFPCTVCSNRRASAGQQNTQAYTYRILMWVLANVRFDCRAIEGQVQTLRHQM